MALLHFNSSTRQKKFIYACVLFIDEKSVASVKTSKITPAAEKFSVDVDDIVEVLWKSGRFELVFPAKVLFLHSK